jgi:exopolyphosphatase / guanosine-5'-triphosphate,3'-diphosphate pyrophosphatase
MERIKFAAIDIGSNAIRLMIMSVSPYKGIASFNKELLIRIPLRLGQESFESGKITDEKLKQLLRSMKAFKQLMKVHGVISYRACATAAMREAKNVKAVVKRVRTETNLKIEIIDGQEEAKIIFDTHSLYNLSDQSNYLFVDVGGGSTEISLISHGELVQSFSYKVGTVRMLLQKMVVEDMDRMRQDMEILRQDYIVNDIIGSGGNIIKLHTLTKVRKDRKLTVAGLETINETLKNLSVEERMNQYKLKEDRADVITYAADIYLEVAKTIGAKNFIVPKIGLIDGIIHLLFVDWLSKKKNKEYLFVNEEDSLTSAEKE